MMKSIDHIGQRCSDPRGIVEFYTQVLGAKFVRAVAATKISTGEDTPHLNVFLRLPDGSQFDFVDAPLLGPPVPDPNTPSWVRHIAMRVDTHEHLLEMKRRVEARGLKVDGPVTRGPNHGVYFTDPWGNRLEATWSSAPPPPPENSPRAWEILEQWEQRKAKGDYSGL
jgi:glyoxylase I family protein